MYLKQTLGRRGNLTRTTVASEQRPPMSFANGVTDEMCLYLSLFTVHSMLLSASGAERWQPLPHSALSSPIYSIPGKPKPIALVYL